MKILVVIIIMTVAPKLLAQHMHVNIFVEFSRQVGMPSTDSVVDGPWLVIQYHNNTGSRVYLPKLANPIECEYPLVSSDVMVNVPRDRREYHSEAVDPIQPHTNAHYMVRITPTEFSIYCEADLLNDYEQLLREKLTGEEPEANRDYDMVNYHIGAKINKKQRGNGCPEYTNLWKKLKSFEDDPLAGIQLGFLIFMDTGAVYEERFDISAFMEYGGSYCYALDKSIELSTGGVIYYNKPFHVRQIYRFSNIDFPKNINGYEFYDGQIYANSTQVRFLP